MHYKSRWRKVYGVHCATSQCLPFTNLAIFPLLFQRLRIHTQYHQFIWFIESRCIQCDRTRWNGSFDIFFCAPSRLFGRHAIRLKLKTTTTQNTIWFASKQVHTGQLCAQTQLLLLISCIERPLKCWRGPEPEIMCYMPILPVVLFDLARDSRAKLNKNIPENRQFCLRVEVVFSEFGLICYGSLEPLFFTASVCCVQKKRP